jgi:hypothetical protein
MVDTYQPPDEQVASLGALDVDAHPDVAGRELARF